MTSNEFRGCVEKAVRGDNHALEELLKLYMPLINRQSMLEGRLDEDLRQYIMMRIVLSISSFEV